MGRALGNNLINMTAYKEVKDALDEIGFDLNLEDFAKQNFQGMIASHVTHFFGLCPECYHNKK
jgi:hypothetical protein